jgi:hypothetical protein
MNCARMRQRLGFRMVEAVMIKVITAFDGAPASGPLT